MAPHYGMTLDMESVVRPYIAGAPAEIERAPTIELVDPSTGGAIAAVVVSDESLVDTAVEAARGAQRVWRSLAPERRGELMLRWAELVRAACDELAELDTLTMGRPLHDTQKEAPGIARRINYWSGMADKITGKQLPIAPGHLSYTIREPLGVVGVITPWNGPLAMFIGRTAASIACGNAVVVKPSDLTPLSALRAAELTVEAGIPAGLVNVVTGGPGTGAAVASHPGVAGVSFTGSVATGRTVATLAAPTFKRVVLELGGKAPNIVFADADLDAAVRGTVWGVFSNSGQACIATTRLLVERSVAAEVVERIVALAKRLKVGDPRDPDVHLGPVASERQFERVCEYIELGRSDGVCRPLEGGGRDGRGYYVDPVVFADVEPGMRIAQEEIFGPVLSVIPFEGEDEAVEIGNSVEYGLSANIWTRDVGRMLRLTERLEAGTIWGNTARIMHPGLPFGGFKNSGLGNASGDGAIEGNTQIKRVSILYAADQSGPEWSL